MRWSNLVVRDRGGVRFAIRSHTKGQRQSPKPCHGSIQSQNQEPCQESMPGLESVARPMITGIRARKKEQGPITGARSRNQVKSRNWDQGVVTGSRSRNQARRLKLGLRVWSATGLVTNCSDKVWHRNRKIYAQRCPISCLLPVS